MMYTKVRIAENKSGARLCIPFMSMNPKKNRQMARVNSGFMGMFYANKTGQSQ